MSRHRGFREHPQDPAFAPSTGVAYSVELRHSRHREPVAAVADESPRAAQMNVNSRAGGYFSSLSPAASMTFFQRSNSALKNSVASSDPIPIGSTPSVFNREASSGS